MSVQPPPSPSAERALLIEDDAHNLFAISLILRDLGVQFKRNTSGAKAWQQAATMQPPPDFILLDLDLPGADALFILRRLKHQPTTRAIPIIAMIDHACADRGETALGGGAIAVLTKPFSRRQLADLLAALFPREAAPAPVWHEG